MADLLFLRFIQDRAKVRKARTSGSNTLCCTYHEASTHSHRSCARLHCFYREALDEIQPLEG